MSENFIDSNIAIIGGGRFCKLFLQYLFDEDFMDRSPSVLGVADINSQAESEVLAVNIMEKILDRRLVG